MGRAVGVVLAGVLAALVSGCDDGPSGADASGADVIDASPGGLVQGALERNLADAKINTARIGARNLEASLETLNLSIGRYPTAAEGLSLLVRGSAPGWSGPYVENGLPKDPWGADYVYVPPVGDGQPRVMSYGADRAAGGTNENADILSR